MVKVLGCLGRVILLLRSRGLEDVVFFSDYKVKVAKVL